MRTQKQWVCFGILALLVLVLTASGLGIIANGQISITIIHIPIIIATIALGLPEGLALSLLFGLVTIVKASAYPEGSLDALFQDPVVSVFPRLMIALAVWLVWKLVRRIADDHTISSQMICSGFAAIFGVLANATFVMTALAIRYPSQLGVTTSVSAATTVITNIIGVNVLFELLSAVVASALFVPLLQRVFYGETLKNDRPIRKTFQKWLLLFITAIFFVMLFFFYNLLSSQERANAQTLLEEKCSDVVTMLAMAPDALTDRELTLGEGGCVLVAQNGVVIYSGDGEIQGKTFQELGLVDYEPETMFYATLGGVAGECMAEEAGEYTVIASLPDSEIYAQRNRMTGLLLGGLLCLFLLMYVNISDLVQRSVVHKIQDVNDSLLLIQRGDLEEQVSVESNTEFVELSQGINATVQALKDAMAQVAARMDQEMEFAHEIQHSVLPVAEHVATAGGEYEVLGTMDTAREVGGDFFDYFLIGEDKLGVVIADVSGKGIPAALFMMSAKTLLKNFVLAGKSPAQALEMANRELCENNESGMFVTVWLGVLNYKTGELEFANAGHNPPLLKRSNGDLDYMDHKTYKRGLVLAAMDTVRYVNNRILFAPGDILFLYTDGVTEANNLDGALYGEDRLLTCFRESCQLPPAKLLATIRSDIDQFVGQAEQFDDITMVVLKIRGGGDMNQLTIDATVENIPTVTDFVDEQLERYQCPMKAQMQINIAIDELFGNIAHYAYHPDVGPATVKVEVLKDPMEVVITFIDSGVPYDPLAKDDPDTSLSADERELGGLGIYMVKKTMDDITYEYRDGKNILRIKKSI